MKKLVCLGDSLTENADLERYAAWPSLLANRLRTEVINRGIGGDTTGGMLARFPVEVVPAGTDGVVILGGTNDLWWGLESRLVLANLFAMVCQARHAGIAPLLVAPPPIDIPALEKSATAPPAMGFDALSVRLEKLATEMAREAAGGEIAFLDGHRLFVDGGGWYLEDGLHLNRRGQQRMAAAVADTLAAHYLVAAGNPASTAE